MARLLELKLGGAHSTLMFDDTHWMDSSSWALLNAVMTLGDWATLAH